LKWARSQTTVTSSTRWLDFGAGSSGLVRYLRTHGVDAAIGYEPSTDAPRVEGAASIPLDRDSLADLRGAFDVVTAIEVIEHVERPVDELRLIAELLAPRGVLLLTTTNARPYVDKLASWRYIIPEIHISFFTPETLSTAMEMAGLTAERPGFVDGWTDIIRYKALKNAGIRHTSLIERVLPWPLLSRLIDKRFGLAAQPVGRRNS
jgi:cyclopropane fatty-acyl-phospholipid synthase-like methyltransferase